MPRAFFVLAGFVVEAWFARFRPGGYRLSMRANASPARTPTRKPCVRASVCNDAAKAARSASGPRRSPSWSGIGSYARAMLRSCARRSPRRVRHGRRAVGSNNRSVAGRCGSKCCSGKKCGSRAATIADKVRNPAAAVVRVNAVLLPRVVSDHDVGPDPPDDRAEPGRRFERVRQFAVDVIEKLDILRRRARRRPRAARRRGIARALRDRRPDPTCPSSRRCRRTS